MISDPRANFDVSGRTALVTGGASGIGLAYVEAMAAAGADVTMLDVDAEAMERETARLSGEGLAVTSTHLDVTDPRATEEVFAAARERTGRLDIVFINAGIDAGPGFVSFGDGGSSRPPENGIEHYDDERWHRIIAVSLDAVFYAIRAAARHMRPQRSGRIIVTTSVSALRPAPGVGAAYMAAKAGAAQLVRMEAMELAPDGITVNAIAPGGFVTNLGGGIMHLQAVRDSFAAAAPIGRVAEPEEIKGLALFLASDASSYIVGQQIAIDGGLALGAARA